MDSFDEFDVMEREDESRIASFPFGRWKVPLASV